MIDDVSEYLAEWQDSELPARHLRMREGGGIFIHCDGHDWEVQSFEDLPAQEEREAHVKVVWADSWRRDAELENARMAIAVYERSRQAATGIPDPARSENGEVALQPRFRPIPGEDYSTAVRTFAHGLQLGPNHRIHHLLLQTVPVRPTVFRDGVMTRRKDINIGRGCKLRAMLSYASAFLQPTPCERCAQGRGPFPFCVVGLAGMSCVNCSFDEDGTACDFHHLRMDSRLQ